MRTAPIRLTQSPPFLKAIGIARIPEPNELLIIWDKVPNVLEHYRSRLKLVVCSRAAFFYKESYFIPTYSYSKIDVTSKSVIAKAIVKAPRHYFTERGVVR